MARPRLLLVDDNRVSLELAKEFFKQSAVRIYTAMNGREVLDLVNVVRPDLIFMDLHMPVMDGAACCAALKSDPDLFSIPIVMLTIASNEGDLARCRTAGCDAILSKPINRRMLLDCGLRFLPNIGEIDLRIPCVTQVVFKMGNDAGYGTSADLSTNGIFVTFNGEVEMEDRLSLTFSLPENEHAPIEAVGRVAWINRGMSRLKPTLPEGFGVEFLDMSRDSAALIRGFMEQDKTESFKRIENAYIAQGMF
ncbi:MAG: response regulator [Geobacter sp.]|nr:response regulator [Geobacter sp.]